jgi:serine/threonine-protein kinase
VDATGAVYVADRNNNRVVKLPSRAPRPGCCPSPASIAPDGVAVGTARGRLRYDEFNNRVVKLPVR